MNRLMLAAALVFLLTAGLMPLVLVALRRLQATDNPTARSSHTVPTLRGGGVGPWAAVLLVSAMVPSMGGQLRAGLLIAGVGFGLIGLLEDLIGVDAGYRFLAQLGVAAAAVASLLPLGAGTVLAVLSVVGLVAYVNAFNFMDGINGISGMQAAVTGLGYVAIGIIVESPVLIGGGAVIAAAGLGFLPFNFPRARVFLGDAGSYFFGGWVGMLAVLAVMGGAPVEAAVAPLALYLADTGTTLVKRVWRGESWHLPHRSHTYQRLLMMGWSHRRVTSVVTALTALCIVAGITAIDASAGIRASGVASIAVVLTGYLCSPRLLERFAPTRGMPGTASSEVH